MPSAGEPLIIRESPMWNRGPLCSEKWETSREVDTHTRSVSCVVVACGKGTLLQWLSDNGHLAIQKNKTLNWMGIFWWGFSWIAAPFCLSSPGITQHMIHQSPCVGHIVSLVAFRAIYESNWPLGWPSDNQISGARYKSDHLPRNNTHN